MNPPLRPQEPLTQAESDEFQLQRKRVILAGVAVFSFAGLMAINQNFFRLETNAFVIFIFVGAIILWGLIQVFKYKCPRCGTTPMMTRPSFGVGQVEAGSFVALFPKKCFKCGVSFAPPAPSC